MASLVLSHDTLHICVRSEHLEITQREPEKDRNTTRNVPLYDVDRVVVVGRPDISMAALAKFMDMGIPCFFVTSRGRWRGAITPDDNLNAARRIRQYEQGTDGMFSLRVVRQLVYAKLRNSRRVLQRLHANRELTDTKEYEGLMKDMNFLMLESQKAESVDVARGLEGYGAALYFESLGKFFPSAIPFSKRTRRPPKDPANALLSFGYTILLGEMESAIRKHGLDAGIGCLHTDRTNTPSLALDLMEPLRAPVVDLLVLNIVNHLMVSPEGHFEVSLEDGGTYLNAEGRKSFFAMYEQAMTRKFAIARNEPHTDLRQVVEAQVTTYLKHLEQNEDEPFFYLP